MLQGIRIVEIEGLGPGPFAAMMLADLGADVVVVHRKSGSSAPGAPQSNPLDRGKRAIALDLKDPGDLQVVRLLVSRADGLIEGFRPGVMERLGLGPADCQALNPRLVYGRMTGWGQTGPRAQEAGHDLNYVSLSGAAWYASDAGQAPFTPPTLVGDIGGGALYLVAGMLAGIIRAGRSGQGTVVDAAIVDGSAHMMNLLMSLGASGGLSMQRGQSILDGPHWSRAYACADGGWISVQCLEPKFYATFLETLGLQQAPELASQYDPAQWPAQTAVLAAVFSAQPQAHWADLFAGTDACVAPVLSPERSAQDPHMQARGTWAQVDGLWQAAPAPRFDGQPPHTPAAAPLRGQHTQDILAELAGAPRPMAP